MAQAEGAPVAAGMASVRHLRRALSAAAVVLLTTGAASAAALVPEAAAGATTPTSVPFSYTGGEQSFTVPQGVTSLSVVATGAGGGSGNGGGVGGAGGLGAQVTTTLSVTPGETLYVEVGGGGAPGSDSGASGGFNGGGASAPDNFQGLVVASGGGGGGGGASDIRTCSITATTCANGAASSLASRLVVAAGGGGGGGGEGPIAGGAGGAAGADGSNGGGFGSGSGGGAGTSSAGGAAGPVAPPTPPSLAAHSGALGTGGIGSGGSGPGGGGGGGGGGGYYGGGGGAAGTYSGEFGDAGGGGGGGGSSYGPTDTTFATATSPTPSVVISYAPPTITSADTTTFTVGQAGTFTVTATGVPTPTFSLSGSVPTWLSIDLSSGVLSGTPAAGSVGSYPITFTASNGVGSDAVQHFTLVVDEAPAITSADTTTFTVGQAGTFTVTATGTPSPTFSLSGSVPSWLSVDPTTGVLSGTPPAGSGGTDTFTVTASNGVTPDATQPFTLVVDEAPSFANPDTTTFTVGQAGLFELDVNGYPPGSVSESGTLPKGVSYLSSAALSGTPAAGSVGSYPITFTASNGVAPDAVQHFTLVVDEAPAITSADTMTFRAGDVGSFQVTTTGYPTPTFTEVGVLPTGVTLSSSGLLSGTPAKGTAGTYGIVVTASNGVLPDATQAFTLTVLREVRPLPVTRTTVTTPATSHPTPPAPAPATTTAATGSLALTGIDLVGLIGGAVVLLVGGAALWLMGQRRRGLHVKRQ